jgi:hypothetical protein
MASQGEVPLIASSWPGAQSLDLDLLMAELRARVSAALRSEDRLSELLDAVVAVSAAAEASKARGGRGGSVVPPDGWGRPGRERLGGAACRAPTGPAHDRRGLVGEPWSA